MTEPDITATEAPITYLPPSVGTRLLAELRDLAKPVPGQLPVTMFALPRWVALRLVLARASEMEKPVAQAYADALRSEIVDGQAKGPACILWLSLPKAEHPDGGCFVFCHAVYEAAVVLGWRSRKPLMWPRSFSECPDVPMLPWRSDQESWCANTASCTANMRDLMQEAAVCSRRNPAIVSPSLAVIDIITTHAEKNKA